MTSRAIPLARLVFWMSTSAAKTRQSAETIEPQNLAALASQRSAHLPIRFRRGQRLAHSAQLERIAVDRELLTALDAALADGERSHLQIPF